MMPKNTTIRDVALAANVSISTVSRVMNGYEGVDPAMAQRVRQAAQALHYLPNANARGIRGKASRTIAVVLPHCGELYFSQLMEGILQGCDEHEMRPTVLSCHGLGDPAREIEQLRTALSVGAQGLLYCPSAAMGQEELRSILPAGLPSVILYRRDMAAGVPHIYHDHVQGGYLATKYLLRLGRRSIAFFAGFRQAPADDTTGLLSMLDDPRRGAYPALDRLAGHIQALRESGLEFDPAMLQPTCDFSFESGYLAARQLLSTARVFDAAVCENDAHAAGVIQALREQNLRIPEEVSIVGYDDSEMATITRPPLTSVKQRPHLLGRDAVGMLDQLLEGESVSDRCLAVQLVVRNSTFSRPEDAR